MPELHIENVCLSYGAGPVQVIDNVSLTVPEHQFSVIVGPSGCGKTSLLRMVAGLEKPTSGRLRLGDDVVTGPGADRGMVFQSYTLFPWETVRGNIEFGLRLKGMPKAERKDISDHFLRQVGLAGFADTHPAHLSGGMMQRVAIARALANDPSILLMDEPFGALDSQTRGLMQELLTRIWSENRSQILFVTHDIEEAVFLAQRIFVMGARPGRIREIIDVPFAYPRTIETLTCPDFIRIRQQVLAAIREEVLKMRPEPAEA
ncbi:MAG: ABC transporter ATP-binding protein [Zavarzinia sp.]|nr:ABC transporter ATP-binding protein [Zavarzinia sp.]